MFTNTPKGIASAWTNFVEITDSSEEAAAKLLEQLQLGGARWVLASTMVDKLHRKNPSSLINARKREIAEQIGLKPEAIPFLQGVEYGRYFFLKPKGTDGDELILSEPAAVIQLCLIASLMNRTSFGANELRTDSIGPHIFVGARSFTTKKGDAGIEAFELRTQFRHGVIQPTLSAKVMKTMPGGIVTGNVSLETGDQGFMLSTLSPDKIKKWDGRKTRLRDITFEKTQIRGSRFFLLNRVIEVFCRTLDAAGVHYKRTEFAPTHTVTSSRVNLERLGNAIHKLLIVNNTGADLGDAEQQRIVDAIQIDGIVFPSISFFNDGHPVEDRAWSISLDSETAYLVLNQGSEEFGSIRIEGEPCDRPWEAYHALSQDILGAEDVDPYTWVKYASLYKRKKDEYTVLQGLDCLVNEGSVFIPDVPAKKLPSVRRCAIELTVKSHFAKGIIPIEDGLINGDFTLLYTDRVKLQLGSLKGDVLSMASVVKIRVCGGSIIIKSHDFYPDMSLGDMGDLFSLYPCLNKKIRSDSFYAIDEINGVFLQRFSGAIIPKIILNSRYLNIDSALEEMERGGGVSNIGSYSRSVDWSLLPFYIAPGKEAGRQWRDTSYIEDQGIFLRYFVPSLLPADVSMGFSNLNDLMVYRLDQPLTNGMGFMPIEKGLLNVTVVKLYLSTLTSGVTRLGETSKASLLEKIARLGGMDT